MATSKSASLATALLGAAGGALAIYLLDPEAGKEHRAKLAAMASDTVGTARQHMESLAAMARNHAEQARDAAADTFRDAARPMHDAARSRLADAAGVASTARNLVSQVIDETQSALDELKSRGRHAVSALKGEEPASHVVPIALGAAGFCAAGVGLMWLFDPKRGRSRRARLGQQANHILTKTSRTFNSTGRHLRNKMTGYVAVAHRSLDEHLAETRAAVTE